MEQDRKFQTTNDYIGLLKRVLCHRSTILWIILSVLALSVAFITQIPVLSLFVELSPMTGLFFLLIIFLILIIPENRDTEIGIPGLTISLLSILLIIAIVGIAISWLVNSFYMSNLIQFGFMFIIPLLVVLYSTTVKKRNIGFSWGSRLNIGWTVVICLIYGLLVWILIGARGFYELSQMVQPHIWINLIPQAVTLAIFLITFAVAIPEEFLFRAVLQPAMLERVGRINGILASSLIFGIFHIPANYWMYSLVFAGWSTPFLGAILMSFLFQAQIGLVLGAAYEWTKSLVMPVALHALHDVIEMLPYFVLLVGSMTVGF
ncbi:MAG: lysostaphin resistance A-like protein [Candidatus Thorarchaeota archaeon]